MNNVVIIGLGYVGLPLAAAASAAGLCVTGLDRSARVVEGLSKGTSHIDDLSDQDIREMLDRGFSATTDESVLNKADVIVICVPTPLALDGSPDLGAIRSASEMTARQIERGSLVVLESTTFPGTTEDVLLPMLAGVGAVGVDFYLAFSPERVDPGNERFTITNTPKVVGGVTPACSARVEAFYSTFIQSVVVAKGAKEAETAKLLENTYRHINIALVNEMAQVCHELDIDIWDVIRCASTKPFGFQAFYPGPGVGGHCIPIDPNYLSYAVKSRLGYPLRFVELAQEINATMPTYVFRRIQDLLNDRGSAVRHSRVLLVGVTYKPNISDQRESPAVDVYTHLNSAGADVAYFDPMVDLWAPQGKPVVRHGNLDEVSDFDVVVVLQHHDDVSLEALAQSGTLVFDSRGILTGPMVGRL